MSSVRSLKRRRLMPSTEEYYGDEDQLQNFTERCSAPSIKIPRYSIPSISSSNVRRKSSESRATSHRTNKTRHSKRYGHIHTAKSVKSHAHSERSSRKMEHEPYNQHLTTETFFNGINNNPEYGKDFLREMDLPLCNYKPVQLPLNLRNIHPGRCIELSIFGHNAIMGFQCEDCTKTQNTGNRTAGFIDQSNKTITIGPTNENELFSITLAFFNNADKVVQHKAFYLSLLSHSLETVRQSFSQPSLLYTYLLFKNFCKQTMTPVFTQEDHGLAMFLLFNDSKTLHINEQCIRLAADNLIYYSITFDCLHGTYVMALRPEYKECQKINIPEDEICAAVSSLDYSDEIREAIIENTNKICTMLK